MLARLIALSLALAPLLARADDDPARLYDLTVDATRTLKQGASGHVTVKITPKGGAEVHKEAPVSLELSPVGVTPAKKKVGRAELAMDGANATFDVPFTADAAGAGRIDTTLKFYICTEKVCASQERKATLPITVEPR